MSIEYTCPYVAFIVIFIFFIFLLYTTAYGVFPPTLFSIVIHDTNIKYNNNNNNVYIYNKLHITVITCATSQYGDHTHRTHIYLFYVYVYIKHHYIITPYVYHMVYTIIKRGIITLSTMFDNDLFVLKKIFEICFEFSGFFNLALSDDGSEFHVTDPASPKLQNSFQINIVYNEYFQFVELTFSMGQKHGILYYK